MGENSIINISVSRVNDWEPKRLSAVRDLSRVPKQRECEIASIAIGVDRRDIDRDPSASNNSRPRDGSAIEKDSKKREVEKVEKNDFRRVEIFSGRNYGRIAILSSDRHGIVERNKEAKELGQQKREAEEKEEVREKFKIKEEEEENEAKRLKKCRKITSRSRVYLSSTSSTCPKLIQRIFLLFLSLLGTPFPSSFSSSQQFSSVASRGPVLVSGSFLALVSLLVVVLLRPTMAIPTIATVSNDNGASGGTSTSTADPTFNETNATLVRIIQRTRHSVLIEQDNEEEVRDDGVLNFESVATTMKVRRRRNVEYISRQPGNEDEEEEEKEEEEEEDDDEDDEEDAFPASLIPHTWESGHEMRSRLPEAELDTIRRSIVEGLGLERIPDPSKANVSQTEYRRAHEEYLARLQHSRDSGDGRQRRLHTFHPAERSPVTIVDRTRRSPSSEISQDQLEPPATSAQNSILYFPITITEENFIIDHAVLRLLLDPTDTPIEITNHALSLYHVLSTNSRKLITRQALFSNNRAAQGPRWIELDATELSLLLTKENFNNLAIELTYESLETGRALGSYDKQPIVIDSALNIFTTSYPLSEDFRAFRRKRRANPEHLISLHKGRRTECRGENKKCCRHEMTVIFKDLKGFEFIVQPKNFDAGYCKGRCPPRYNPAHHHALLQSLIWKEDKRKAPRPCCAPSKLDELEILYFDENDPTKLKISSWKNMKVLECACS